MFSTIRIPQIALAAALSCAAGLAVAQVVYKIVSPDGRITYSDRAPTEPGLRASLVNRTPASGAVALPPPVTAITPWASLSGDARRGIVPAVPIGETASSPSVITVSLVDALSLVLARAELVQTMRDICVRTAPSASSDYDDAAHRWQQRNAPVVAQTGKVLQGAFDPARRAKIEAMAHTRLSTILTALASASADAKNQWCDQSADAIAHGALDALGPGSVAAPVMDYALR